MSDMKLDSRQHDKLLGGFFSNLNNITATFFTIIPTLSVWYFSKDFKIAIGSLIICLFLTFFYTVNKNSKADKKLIKSIQIELDNYNVKIKNLNELLDIKENKIIELTNELKQITSNRDTILERFDEYRNYKEAYNSAKNGIFVLSNMQNNKSIKNSVEVLFKNIENELYERNEDVERSI